MFKIFKTLLLIVWLIDITNIDFIVNGTHLAYFLDVTLPLNTWFWLLLWLLIPSSEATIIHKED